MTLDAARVIDCGADARVAISLIKFHGATMLHNVIDRAIQVHGALGVTSDRPLDKMYREARDARLDDGPTRSITWSWPATCSATTKRSALVLTPDRDVQADVPAAADERGVGPA
jgi:Acyl-CoA dehydrogenase, C-terminal domain